MRHRLAATLGFIVFVFLSASVFAADQVAATAAIENTLGMKFVLVLAGEFVMGAMSRRMCCQKPTRSTNATELRSWVTKRQCIACASHNLSTLASLKSVSASSANF